MTPIHPSWTLAVLVCCNQRPDGHRRSACGRIAGEGLVAALKDRARAAECRKRLVVHRVGCLDACGNGTTVAFLDRGREIVKVDPSDDQAVWRRVCDHIDGTVTRSPSRGS